MSTHVVVFRSVPKDLLSSAAGKKHKELTEAQGCPNTSQVQVLVFKRKHCPTSSHLDNQGCWTLPGDKYNETAIGNSLERVHKSFRQEKTEGNLPEREALARLDYCKFQVSILLSGSLFSDGKALKRAGAIPPSLASMSRQTKTFVLPDKTNPELKHIFYFIYLSKSADGDFATEKWIPMASVGRSFRVFENFHDDCEDSENYPSYGFRWVSLEWMLKNPDLPVPGDQHQITTLDPYAKTLFTLHGDAVQRLINKALVEDAFPLLLRGRKALQSLQTKYTSAGETADEHTIFDETWVKPKASDNLTDAGFLPGYSLPQAPTDVSDSADDGSRSARKHDLPHDPLAEIKAITALCEAKRLEATQENMELCKQELISMGTLVPAAKKRRLKWRRGTGAGVAAGTASAESEAASAHAK